MTLSGPRAARWSLPASLVASLTMLVAAAAGASNLAPFTRDPRAQRRHQGSGRTRTASWPTPGRHQARKGAASALAEPLGVLPFADGVHRPALTRRADGTRQQADPARVAGVREKDLRFAPRDTAVRAKGEVDARRSVEPGGEDVAGCVLGERPVVADLAFGERHR